MRWPNVDNSSRARRTAAIVCVLAVLSMASDCESDFTRTVAVPVEDSTAPTVGFEIYRGGNSIFLAPAAGALDSNLGTVLVTSSARDLESGISAVELVAETTTKTCRNQSLCSTKRSTQYLQGSWRSPLVPTGSQANTSNLTGGEVDTRPFIPEDPPAGSQLTVNVSLYAQATNNIGASATSQQVVLTYSVGELARCTDFTLAWSWSRLESSDGSFTAQPNCPPLTGDKVRGVRVSLQFDPGTEENQAVTVSHGPTSVSIKNKGTSDEFNGQDPAGQWNVLWGGNVTIRPIGITLSVSAW